MYLSNSWVFSGKNINCHSLKPTSSSSLTTVDHIYLTIVCLFQYFAKHSKLNCLNNFIFIYKLGAIFQIRRWHILILFLCNGSPLNSNEILFRRQNTDAFATISNNFQFILPIRSYLAVHRFAKKEQYILYEHVETKEKCTTMIYLILCRVMIKMLSIRN